MVAEILKQNPKVEMNNTICETNAHKNVFIDYVSKGIEISFSKTFLIRIHRYWILLICVFFITLLIIQVACTTLIIAGTKKQSYANKEYCRNADWTTDNELKVYICCTDFEGFTNCDVIGSYVINMHLVEAWFVYSSMT